MKLIISLVLLSINSFSFAQTIERQVIASAGGSYDDSIQISWTIGETITSFLAADVSLAQGFQQDTATTVQLPLQLLTFTSTPVNSLPLPQTLVYHRAVEPVCLACEDQEDMLSFDQSESTSTEQSNHQIPNALARTAQMQLSLTVYPNPSAGYLTVKVDTGIAEFPDQAMCLIVDNQGKQVYAQPMTAASQSLNLSSFPAGSYQLQVRLTPTSFKHQSFIIIK